MEKKFESVKACESNPKWDNMISRAKELYSRNNDIRSPFERDYTRIIHSQAYRRMKHKTQVFFAPENDHICTRIEHVTLVESVAYTIAKTLGLNIELTRAIATSHDIGHSPFGHQGEKIISQISQSELGKTFWHERNGLETVEKIELLDTPKGELQNLNLTYAVRDGIVSHCGEIDENALKPRDEFIDLDDYSHPNQYAPYTWEGCVVKIADKISYLGRDIADAVTLGILDEHLYELYDLLGISKDYKINNTVLINDLIFDLCENSSLEKGLCFSDRMFKLINDLKAFNYKFIYLSDKCVSSTPYFELIIKKIFETLKGIKTNRDNSLLLCEDLVKDFEDWYRNYTIEKQEKNINDIIFDVNDEKDFIQAIIYFISGMTDTYAIKVYNKIIRV